MKKTTINIILIIVLGIILNNLWNSKEVMTYLWNGIGLIIAIIVYKITNRDSEVN